MSNLGTLIAAVAAKAGIEDSGRSALVMRMETYEAIQENKLRELWFNKKEAVITPLVVGQFIYPQGPDATDLPQDWLAPLSYPSDGGRPTAYITTVDEPEGFFDFLFCTPGEYRRLRQGTGPVPALSRPSAWTMIEESLRLVPAPDLTTYRLVLNYIFDVSFGFTFGITSGAWSGSGDTYTDPWFEEQKGFSFLVNEVTKRLRATYLKDLQNAAGPSQAAAGALYQLTDRSSTNTDAGRRAYRW